MLESLLLTACAVAAQPCVYTRARCVSDSLLPPSWQRNYQLKGVRCPLSWFVLDFVGFSTEGPTSKENPLVTQQGHEL